MPQNALELTEEHFERIGTYVRSHFHQWILEDRTMNGDPMSLQLNRIEQTLANFMELARERFELIRERFEASDKRFESMDKRFESIDKRFESMDKRFEEMDKRFHEQMELTKLESRMLAEKEKTRIDLLEKRLNRHFAIGLAFSSAIFAAVLGVLIQV